MTGALFGTCGGTISGTDGTLFELTPPAPGSTEWTLSSVILFGSFAGKNPNADLVMDDSGAIHGTALSGGANDQGLVFKLTPPCPGATQWAESPLHAFYYDPLYSILDGQGPGAGVIRDASGALYCTTTSGGSTTNLAGSGTVFKPTLPAPKKRNRTKPFCIASKVGQMASTHGKP